MIIAKNIYYPISIIYFHTNFDTVKYKQVPLFLLNLYDQLFPRQSQTCPVNT